MTYEILDACTGCGMCLSICPVKAISGGPGRLHVIDPDFCIGCGACFRVCTSEAVVDQAGNVSVHQSKRFWMIPHFDTSRCHFCGKCYEMCPAGIITRPSSGKVPTLTNSKLCASCYWCQKVCAFNAITFQQASEQATLQAQGASSNQERVPGQGTSEAESLD